MLFVKSINTCYGKVQILRDVSLDVPARKIVAILGANGAGKTTTLRTITGLVNPATGRIEFEGKRIDGFAPSRIVRLGISMVPEERQIFPQMSVFENLEMGAFVRKDAREIRETLSKVFELFPVLKERKNQLSATLSGGEQQMLVFARALMSKPKLLLLDEPSFGLAPLIVDKIFAVMKKTNIEEGCTILLVEQNAQMALSVSHFAYIMEVGRLIMFDESEKLKKNNEVKKAYLGE
jgi:branched-chain amino acid transport system ATP-binding protein